MVLYGPTPTAKDLAHNEEARHYAVPRFDGTDPEPYWNCTRNAVTYKIAVGRYDPYGQYFSIIHSIENQIVEYLLRLVQPNSSIVDVGSAFGSFTLPFLASGHPVYSFEVDPKAFHEMMNHIRLNQFRSELVNCYNIGLYDKETTGDYYDMKRVKFRRLDDVLPDLTNVSFLKIDVEGAELEVMKGGAQLLQHNEPTLWIECHEIFNKGVTQRVLDYVKEIGFKGYTVKEYEMVQGTKHLLIAR